MLVDDDTLRNEANVFVRITYGGADHDSTAFTVEVVCSAITEIPIPTASLPAALNPPDTVDGTTLFE